MNNLRIGRVYQFCKIGQTRLQLQFVVSCNVFCQFSKRKVFDPDLYKRADDAKYPGTGPPGRHESEVLRYKLMLDPVFVQPILGCLPWYVVCKLPSSTVRPIILIFVFCLICLTRLHNPRHNTETACRLKLYKLLQIDKLIIVRECWKVLDKQVCIFADYVIPSADKALGYHDFCLVCKSSLSILGSHVLAVLSAPARLNPFELNYIFIETYFT